MPNLVSVAAVLAFLVAGALASCPDDLPCTRKCCPLGKIIRRGRCRRGHPHVSRNYSAPLVHAKPKCEMYYLESGENHTIHDNGTLTYGGELMEYCVEYNDLNDTRTYVCFPPEDTTVMEKDNMLNAYSYGLWISLPFIFVTFLVYASFQRLWNLHGKCVAFHTFSLFMAYICLLCVQRKVNENEIPCLILGYSIQFFFMATFFWLNVMCFDIYWAFSGLRNLTGSVKEREKKKLICYSIYAWGFPFLILLITLGIDYLPILSNDSVWKPNIGKEKCYFEDDHATGIFFYLPMGLIIITNIILFTITAFRIRSLRRETKVLKGGDSRKHDNTRKDKESLSDQATLVENMKDTYPSKGQKLKVNDVYIKQHIRFSLYLKLFVVMGINWAMELISFLIGGPAYFWYITDFTNTLQGLFIFGIFVWKRRVRRLIWSKIQSCFGKAPISNGSKTPWSGSARYNSSQTNSSGVSGNSMKMQTVSTTPALRV